MGQDYLSRLERESSELEAAFIQTTFIDETGTTGHNYTAAAESQWVSLSLFIVNSFKVFINHAGPINQVTCLFQACQQLIVLVHPFRLSGAKTLT